MKTFEKTIDIEIDNIPENSVFLDIETTGLSPERSHLYLFGCMWREKDKWRLKQWLLESPFEERGALGEIAAFISGFSLLVHFNGERFDLPYLDMHAAERGIPSPFLTIPSLDLYKQLRSCKNLFSMSGARQKDFERFAGNKRLDRFDGGQLIDVYRRYCTSGDAQLLELLLLHNSEDVAGMGALTKLLPYQKLNDPAVRLFETPPVLVNSGRIFAGEDDEALLRFSLSDEYPITVSSRAGDIRLTVEGSSLRLLMPLFCGELKHYFSPARDYYYLPAEDMAIHKSVASYVDPSHREKATPQTCYIKTAGTFIPVLNEDIRDVFRESPSGARYARLSGELLENIPLWNGILHDIFDLIRRS